MFLYRFSLLYTRHGQTTAGGKPVALRQIFVAPLSNFWYHLYIWTKFYRKGTYKLDFKWVNKTKKLPQNLLKFLNLYASLYGTLVSVLQPCNLWIINLRSNLCMWSWVTTEIYFVMFIDSNLYLNLASLPWLKVPDG